MMKDKMKTRNLTQSHAQNDPINRRIHGFSFCDFKDEDVIQDVISPYSLDQFLISNTPRMRKRVKKERNRLTLELWCLDSSINLANPSVSSVREGQFYLFISKKLVSKKFVGDKSN